jgi:hypothetical protein
MCALEQIDGQMVGIDIAEDETWFHSPIVAGPQARYHGFVQSPRVRRLHNLVMLQAQSRCYDFTRGERRFEGFSFAGVPMPTPRPASRPRAATPGTEDTAS